MSRDFQSAVDAIFMKAIAPVGATKPGAIDAIDLPPLLLRFDSRLREYRMSVTITPENTVRSDLIGMIERDAESRWCLNSLQYVHIVR